MENTTLATPNDLERRISEHKTGGYCDFTTRRLPVEFVWGESFPSREEALSAELRVKKWSRAKKEALIAGDWLGVAYFAKPPSKRSTIDPPKCVSTALDTNG